MRAAWAKKRRDASVRKLTKVCPAWLRLSQDRSQFEVIEERAEVVRLIFRETATGIGKAKIAARLNAVGVPSFRGKDGWHSSYVQKLLGSDAPLGVYQPHVLENGRRKAVGPPIANYFPAILDEDLVMSARAAVISRRSGASGRKGADFRNLLSGVARCARCGSSMVYIGKGDEERYLACSSARRRRGCDARGLFNFNEAERRFLTQIRTFDPEKQGGDDTLQKARERLHRSEVKVTHLSERLNKLLELFGADATPEIVAAISQVRDDLAVARTEEKKLRDVVTVETHGAGVRDLQHAVSNLLVLGSNGPLDLAFAARARVAHTARVAGFIALFHQDGRRVELRCNGYPGAVWFSCVPTKPNPTRDPQGRFAQRAV